MQVDLKEIQDRLSLMMNDLHFFFDKHGINYFLYCGSLLGAIRHQGFIPWDDDMDIGMLREDFDKLMDVVSQMPSPYKLRYHHQSGTDMKYPYPFAKIEDSSTILIENTIKHLGIKSGLYIDLFIFDKIPNNIIKRIAHKMNYSFWCLQRNLILINPNKKRNCFKQCVVLVAQKFFSIDYVIAKMISIAQKYKFEDCKYCSTFTRKINPSFEYCKMQKGNLLTFGIYKFYGVKDNDYLLKKEYGDYMQLPPEEKRVGHHAYEIITYNSL